MATPKDQNPKTWVDNIEDQYVSLKGSLKENISQPICDVWKQVPIDEWSKTYYQPLAKQYEKWPACLANFKQENIISKANENQRLICLGLSTLAIVSVTRKFSPGILKIVRNSVVTYFGLGLLIAPEIYNPFLVDKKE